MDFLKCNECKYEKNCPVMWSYCNAACITIQKKKENKMDNRIYEVERDEYKIFLAQLDTKKIHTEESWLDKIHIVKIISNKANKHLSSRIHDTELNEEHYFIFHYPDDDERAEPKPVRQFTLETKEQVKNFFEALNKLQSEGKENGGTVS